MPPAPRSPGALISLYHLFFALGCFVRRSDSNLHLSPCVCRILRFVFPNPHSVPAPQPYFRLLLLPGPAALGTLILLEVRLPMDLSAPLLVAVAAAAGITYLVFQPKIPKYSVDGLSVKDFNLVSTRFTVSPHQKMPAAYSLIPTVPTTAIVASAAASPGPPPSSFSSSQPSPDLPSSTELCLHLPHPRCRPLLRPGRRCCPHRCLAEAQRPRHLPRGHHLSRALPALLLPLRPPHLPPQRHPALHPQLPASITLAGVSRSLFVCNHCTALDPILISIVLGCSVSCITYSISRIYVSIVFSPDCSLGLPLCVPWTPIGLHAELPMV